MPAGYRLPTPVVEECWTFMLQFLSSYHQFTSVLHVYLAGAVHYGRNGHHVASLMHVDHTLPMWAFFDVYGSVQKIKLLGNIGHILTYLVLV